MAFRRFRANVTIRVLLLAVTSLLIYPALARQLYAATALIGLLIALEIYSLIRYVERTNRELARFLESIRYNDFSAGFTTGTQGPGFDELNRIYSEVVQRFREINLEKEESYRYLQAVVQHVGIGMIAFSPDGEVALINAAAKKLFDIPRLGRIDDLSPVSPGLVDILKSIEPGGSELIKIIAGGDLLQIFVYATELRLRRTILKLVSFQNISPELEAKEMEAWQNLIRVLTHEIKNSLTPIASLTSSMEDMLAVRERAEGIDDETLQDIHEALRTIKKRSEGLLRFTDAYRSLTKIKEPELQSFQVSELAARVGKLSSKQIAEAGGSLFTHIEPPDLMLHADPQLVEQVLINLLLNSIDAIEGKQGGRIEISAFVDKRNHIVIRVTDNGRGIVDEALEKIFIPFYSTKKEGSGIGLSLSRQIMRLHRGELIAESEPDVRTVFTMRF
jgi:two-component system nitrogen regulation sensor histidine kinase NtrY